MAKSVLLVDDHVVIRNIMREWFEAEGFIVSEAANGAQAVEQAEQHRPDVIIMDLAMPVMNGLEAAPLLKERLPKTPIILFTMYATGGLAERASAAGIAAVVSKEAPIGEVVAKAQSLLNLSSASAES